MAPKPVSLQCKSVFLLFFLITIQTSSSSPLFSSSSSDFNPPYPKAISLTRACFPSFNHHFFLGKLDQLRRCFEVQFAAGRDLRPG
ncbi:hypothetical protein CMV_022593 [Castanea mollissima]|uniref:Uncharacterized protein n=1 Tax=Castanea mollissima TaxID=60419 RepID=A0A8J4VK46_9ROSI|nr:hypothetical protein CMV_022593 [Castanea mollissima]